MMRRLRRGYTMIELLLVMGVIGILVLLLVTSVGNMSRSARRARVETEVAAIEQALRAYYQLYDRYPRHTALGSGVADPEEDVDYGLDVNEDMVRLLRGENHPEKSGSFPDQNPRKVAFMEISDESLDGDGNFVDAWGNPYRYMCDFNYDSKVRISRLFKTTGGPWQSKPLEGHSVAVWSMGPAGPDARVEETDLIRSWE